MILGTRLVVEGCEEITVTMIKQDGRADWPCLRINGGGEYRGPHDAALYFDSLEDLLAFGRKIVNEAESIQSDINRAELEKACREALAAFPAYVGLGEEE
jgi:hypothetical protein